jgi:adenine C2-methylase RlmN of 23S rRNA A2503 and tRNA A37
MRIEPGRLHAQLPLLPHRTMQLVRNLEPAEIVGQVMLAAMHSANGRLSLDGRMLTNIVMMGMGDPSTISTM